jgi:uncharacterized linocin/CFP29 family protein
MNNTASKFNWNQDTVNNLVHDAAIEVRVVRPLLKLYGQQGAYTTNIVGHPIRNGQQDKGSPLNIPINQFLTPLILSCDIRLQQEQFGDADALNTLAVEAAYRVSAAEDAVILLGKDASCFLDKLGVKANREQLAAQVGLVPLTSPSLKNEVTSFLKIERPILESIVGGIADLENAGRIGRYAAVVSLELYQEAMKPRTSAMDAPIYEIRPLLVEGGFRSSQVLTGRTGVIFSLNGDGIKIAIPVDTSIEFVEEKKDVFLQVVEQLRLVVDVPEAVVALQ